MHEPQNSVDCSVKTLPVINICSRCIHIDMNSEHFSADPRIAQLHATSNPTADLNDLGVNDFSVTEKGKEYHLGKEAERYVILDLKYTDSEDWYWLYGEKRLYEKFLPYFDDKIPPPETWLSMQRFVTDFAWVESQFRFILDKPCWPLHMDAVDQIVALYYARKNYEQARSSSPPSFQREYILTLRELVDEIRELLSKCEIKRNPNDGANGDPYVQHIAESHAKDWIPSLLQRVLQWGDIELPGSPVMAITKDSERTARTLLGEGEVTEDDIPPDGDGDD